MGAILHCPLSLQPVWSWIMQILPTISEYTAQESTHFCSFSWHTGSFMSHDWYWWKHPWNFHIQQIHARSWLIFHVFDAHVLYICYGNTLPPAKELDEHHVRSHSIQLMNHSWCRIAHSKATLTKQTAAINNTEFWANQKQSAYKPTVASVTPGVCPMLHHKEPRKHFYLHLHSDSSRSATLTLFLPSRCSFSRRAETHLPPAWHRAYHSKEAAGFTHRLPPAASYRERWGEDVTPPGWSSHGLKQACISFWKISEGKPVCRHQTKKVTSVEHQGWQRGAWMEHTLLSWTLCRHSVSLKARPHFTRTSLRCTCCTKSQLNRVRLCTAAIPAGYNPARDRIALHSAARLALPHSSLQLTLPELC